MDILKYIEKKKLNLPVSVIWSNVGSEAVVFPSVPGSCPVDPSIALSASELPPESRDLI